MIFVFIGLAIFILGIILILIDHSAKYWKETYGYVTKSELNRSYHTDTDGSDYYHYRASVTYEYFIPKTNRKYESSKIFPIIGYQSSTDKQEHISIKNKLSIGKKILVYYSPYNNKKACLVVGKNFHLMILLFLGLTIIGISSGIKIKEIGKSQKELFIDKIEVIK